MWFRYSERKIVELYANYADSDQTLHSAASDLAQHCLPVILLGVSRLQWVNLFSSKDRETNWEGSLNLRLTFTTLWASSADDEMMIFVFPEKTPQGKR